MGRLGFESGWEVLTYCTCVMLGISMLMPMNALISAPRFMVDYYKYVTGDPEAKPESKLFWANVLTFYNVASLVIQIIVGPTVLTPAARRLSLRFRFFLALSLMMVEVLVVVILPAVRVSQTSAIVAFIIVTVLAGAGKAYLEGTCYALVSNMAPKYMSAVMFGCGFSGVLSSILQCIIKSSMSEDYQSTLTQAAIYFSLALVIMFVSMILALLLEFNPFAQKHVGEYRMAALRRRRERDRMEPEEGRVMAETEPYSDNVVPQVTSGEVLDESVPEEKKLESDSTNSSDDMPALTTGCDQKDLTTSEQMMATPIWPVLKKVYPMMITCFCVFFLSLLIMPSLIIPIDRDDNWFGTIAIMMYNIGDASGRLSTTFRFLWPSRKVLMAVAGLRFLFLIPIFLCVYHYIPGHVAPYIFQFLIGLTNGFFGATTMVYGPLSEGIMTAGERVMAGQAMGVSLLGGASFASLIAIVFVVWVLP